MTHEHGRNALSIAAPFEFATLGQGYVSNQPARQHFHASMRPYVHTLWYSGM